jgi:serine/threonine-protein kinase RsbW/stage II sporulation protein AB (anti-sigma F factor)
VASHFWNARPEAEEVRRLRHEVTAYAADQGLAAPVIEAVSLALTEAVTNAVLHAFPDDVEGTITVMATVHGDELTLRVVDDGVGLRPRTDSPGAGLGLAIAGRVARRMVVERPERGGTEVRMTFATTA